MRRKSAAVALALTFVFLAGCGRWKEVREAEAAVRAYNEAIVVAYRTNDPRGLEDVAGPKELRKLVALIDLKRNANLMLESRIEEFEVLGVEISGAAAATVRTRERWRYWDRALKPGIPAGQVFVADMWMTWTLGREAGRMRVLGGKTERSVYIEPKGFRPGGGGVEPGHGEEKPGPKREGA